jgi:ribosomal subunit interface protein
MALKIHIKTKHLDLTPEISSHIHERMNVIEKYIDTKGDRDILVEVEVGRRLLGKNKGNVYRAEANVSGDGTVYRATTKSQSITDALDDLKDEITKVIKRRQNKKNDLTRKGGRLFKKILRRD